MVTSHCRHVAFDLSRSTVWVICDSVLFLYPKLYVLASLLAAIVCTTIRADKSYGSQATTINTRATKNIFFLMTNVNGIVRKK